METFLAIWLTALGLVVGSFLNVVIARLPRELPWADEPEPPAGPVGALVKALPRDSALRVLLWPPSRCPRCGRLLRWYENIPLVSWLVQRGKCRGCGAPISVGYPLVEALTGALYLACLVRFDWTPALALALTLVTVLVALIFIDAQAWVLPDELTLGGTVLGLTLQALISTDALVAGLVGAIAGFLGFRALEFLGWLLTRREALGGGDKFLLLLIGAFLGWRPLFGVVALASVLGAIWGLAMLGLYGRASGQGEDAVPLNPGLGTPAPDAPTETAGPPATQDEALVIDATAEGDFTPAFARPGLSWAQRLRAVPWTLLLQPIPDEPEPTSEEQAVEWVPGPSNMPFGPWLGVAALMVLLGSRALLEALEGSAFRLTAEIFLGSGWP